MRNVEVMVAARQDGSLKYRPQPLTKLRRHVNNLIVLQPKEESHDVIAAEAQDLVENGKVAASEVLDNAAHGVLDTGLLNGDSSNVSPSKVSCIKVQYTASSDPLLDFRNLVTEALPVAEEDLCMAADVVASPEIGDVETMERASQVPATLKFSRDGSEAVRCQDEDCQVGTQDSCWEDSLVLGEPLAGSVRLEDDCTRKGCSSSSKLSYPFKIPIAAICERTKI